MKAPSKPDCWNPKNKNIPLAVLWESNAQHLVKFAESITKWQAPLLRDNSSAEQLLDVVSIEKISTVPVPETAPPFSSNARSMTSQLSRNRELERAEILPSHSSRQFSQFPVTATMSETSILPAVPSKPWILRAAEIRSKYPQNEMISE
jgi:hypothetical protein